MDFVGLLHGEFMAETIGLLIKLGLMGFILFVFLFLYVAIRIVLVITVEDEPDSEYNDDIETQPEINS